MCTVSVIAVGGGFRVVCSRDELRTRPAALPPEIFEVDDGVEACWPIDPAGGGTWIGVNSVGVVACVLNVNVPGVDRPAPDEAISRGVLIPKVARFVRAVDAAAAVETLPLVRMSPFRFLAFERTRHGARVVSVRWDRRRIEWSSHEAPACFVSSGLGDELVRPREALFAESVAPSPDPSAQDSFHRHRWADRPQLSVLMSRGDARTVSITTVEVGAKAGESGRVGRVILPGPASLRYEPIDE